MKIQMIPFLEASTSTGAGASTRSCTNTGTSSRACSSTGACSCSATPRSRGAGRAGRARGVFARGEAREERPHEARAGAIRRRAKMSRVSLGVSGSSRTRGGRGNSATRRRVREMVRRAILETPGGRVRRCAIRAKGRRRRRRFVEQRRRARDAANSKLSPLSA